MHFALSNALVRLGDQVGSLRCVVPPCTAPRRAMRQPLRPSPERARPGPFRVRCRCKRWKAAIRINLLSRSHHPSLPGAAGRGVRSPVPTSLRTLFECLLTSFSDSPFAAPFSRSRAFPSPLPWLHLSSPCPSFLSVPSNLVDNDQAIATEASGVRDHRSEAQPTTWVTRPRPRHGAP